MCSREKVVDPTWAVYCLPERLPRESFAACLLRCRLWFMVKRHNPRGRWKMQTNNSKFSCCHLFPSLSFSSCNEQDDFFPRKMSTSSSRCLSTVKCTRFCLPQLIFSLMSIIEIFPSFMLKIFFRILCKRERCVGPGKRFTPTFHNFSGCCHRSQWLGIREVSREMIMGHGEKSSTNFNPWGFERVDEFSTQFWA